MPLLKVHFFSDVLRKMSNLTVVLPNLAFKGKLPVLYQLHGLSDDDSAWTRRSNIERYAHEYPLVVVMPDGGRSFYCDAYEGPRYESFIMKDVIGFVERFFPVGRSRQYRAIGGLSMGGYGAMKLALKYPATFCSVASHSSSFDFAHRDITKRLDLAPELKLLLGPSLTSSPNDVFALASQLDPGDVPAIRFDCGRDDGLLASNREFRRHLRKLRIPHVYAEYPGGHTWPYWDLHVQKALAFHWKHLHHPT